MSLRTNFFRTGALQGVVYDFGAGDVLPMHKHTDADAHISVVARGSFRVHGPAIGEVIYAAGAVLDWGPGVDHEFVALENNSRLVNITRGAPDAA